MLWLYGSARVHFRHMNVELIQAHLPYSKNDNAPQRRPVTGLGALPEGRAAGTPHKSCETAWSQGWFAA